MAATIYTVGYAVNRGATAKHDIAHLMAADPATVLVDIRKSPNSRWYPYRQPALQQCYGGRYIHMPQLGNVNWQFKNLPIVLEDPAAGLPQLLALLRAERSIILICACATVRNPDGSPKCHRLIVAELLAEQCCKEIIHV